MLTFLVLFGLPLVYLPFFFFVTLYASYNFVLFIRSFGKWSKPKKIDVNGRPKVTILYMTYNDLNERALESIFGLNYPNTEVIIVDDSTDPNVRARVDQLAKDRAKVVRRATRRGFKAGAINDALKFVHSEYVSICDSDELLPPNFVEELLPYFMDERVAFVQANHYAYNKENQWTSDMGQGVDLHWSIYQPYRNEEGVVNFLGHGAIIRTDMLREVGGFPELVSEDIALTVELYDRGYRGVFAQDVMVGEAFPPTYTQFKRRHRKWSMGSVEFMRKYALRIVRSKGLKIWQKEDLLLSMMSLPMSAALVFVTIMAFFVSIPVNPSTAIVSALSVIAPQLMFLKARNLRTLPRVMTVNALAFMSLFCASVIYVIRGLFSPTFLVTGHRVS